MTTSPDTRRRVTPPGALVRFDATWAERVVSWVLTERECYWLAPRTPPPLTVAEVARWRRPEHHAYALLPGAGDAPVAYGEVNRLCSIRASYWLGHLVVDPGRRGEGYGLLLTQLLLRQAFEFHGARRVTLVVFPENEQAIRCYLRAGLSIDGHEWHSFPAYGTRERLLRMAVNRPPTDHPA